VPPPGFDADLLIVGGGIVGCSTAMRLIETHPGISVLMLEKEAALAAHQTGHNSGVIHAGVYYAPGSLKAALCKAGATATYAFAAAHGLPTVRCGKLIVATDDVEVARLKDLFDRCRLNGLEPEMLDSAELARIEPHIAGRAAIRVASSGIADYPAITRTMAEIATAGGARILTGHPVLGLSDAGDAVVAETPQGRFRARHAIVCAGLMADRLARMCGVDLDFRIVPFRGEYYRLPASKAGVVSHLIYPAPDPALPFLGVHLTPMIGGGVTVGPNAVLALAREGYRRRDINLRDVGEMAWFPGFWRLIARNGRSGRAEFRNSLWRQGYLRLCRKFCPELTLADLGPHPAGVRAQAVMADGTMAHDFLIRRSARALHVCNAPSPAATSAIPIGAWLVDAFDSAFGEVSDPGRRMVASRDPPSFQ
jgi:L-2-hydroxyglutarate oxidase